MEGDLKRWPSGTEEEGERWAERSFRPPGPLGGQMMGLRVFYVCFPILFRLFTQVRILLMCRWAACVFVDMISIHSFSQHIAQ